MPDPTSKLVRNDLLVVLPFVVALVGYVGNAAPGIVAEGDCSEYVAAARVAGIPHAPGYPTYMLLVSALGQIVPAEHLARALNLASALFGAVTVALLMLLVLRVARRGIPGGSEWSIRGGALLGSLLLGCATEFWNQSLSAEVYTLAAALMVLCLERLSAGRVRAAALVAGLAMGVHYAVGLPCALVVAACALARWREPGAAGLVKVVWAFALGLATFLYLPLRSLAEPALDFGDPQTPGRFWRMLTLADMPTGKAPGRELGVLGEQIAAVAGLARQQWPGWVFVLATLGVFLCVARRGLRNAAAVGVAIFLLDYVGILAVSNFELVDEQVYELRFLFLPAYVVVAGFAGLGIALAAAVLERRMRFLAPALLVLAILPIGSWRESRGRTLDKRLDHVMREYGEALLAAAEGPAVLFTFGDNAWMPLTYLQVVEGRRPDVTVIAAGLLRHPWYRERLRARHPELELREDAHGVNGIAVTNLGRVNVYHADPKAHDLRGFQEIPSGVLRRILPEEQSAKPAVPPAPAFSPSYAMLDRRERSIRADVPNAYLRTAQWCRKSGHLGAAKYALEQGLAIARPDPPMEEFSLVRSALLLERGDHSAVEGRLAEARAMWRGAIDEAPASSTAALANDRLEGRGGGERP